MPIYRKLRTLFAIPPSANMYNWPPFFIAWAFVCYHVTIAISMHMEPRLERTAVLSGLERPVQYLGHDGSILLLLAISISAAIGLLLEYRLDWHYLLAFILPQYLTVAAGAGSHLNILMTGEFMGIDYPRFFIAGLLGFFFWLAFWHTVSMVWRIKYWILLSEYRITKRESSKAGN